MEVLSGADVGSHPLAPSARRYSRRRSSLSLSPCDMLLFRAPRPTYVASSWPGELCVLGSSACLAMEHPGGASKVLLYCHGTSSDLGSTRRSLEILRDGLQCHVVAVEYPGYGLMAGDESNEESVNTAVREAFLHLTQEMSWPADRIIVMGRSLGSGPATRIAKELNPGALLLLAPFTGVKDIAGSIVGETLAELFNLNQWNNKEEIASTTSPTLLLHGLRDEVVPHTHSLELYRVSAAHRKYVGLLLDSDHNRINWCVALDVYLRPFVQMACRDERNRPLGVVSNNIIKLSSISPDGDANFLLACAEAAWARRRSAEARARSRAVSRQTMGQRGRSANGQSSIPGRPEHPILTVASEEQASPPPAWGAGGGSSIGVADFGIGGLREGANEGEGRPEEGRRGMLDTLREAVSDGARERDVEGKQETGSASMRRVQKNTPRSDVCNDGEHDDESSGGLDIKESLSDLISQHAPHLTSNSSNGDYVADDGNASDDGGVSSMGPGVRWKKLSAMFSSAR